MTFVVEEVGASDWRRWRGLRLRALREDPEAFAASAHAWIHGGDTPERWMTRLSGEDRLFVAVEACADLGIVGAAPRGDGTVELISMWVAPEARGRGVGGALVQRVLREAADRSVVLRVMAENARAQAFYAVSGFVPDGMPPDDEGTLTMWRPARGRAPG